MQYPGVAFQFDRMYNTRAVHPASTQPPRRKHRAHGHVKTCTTTTCGRRPAPAAASHTATGAAASSSRFQHPPQPDTYAATNSCRIPCTRRRPKTNGQRRRDGQSPWPHATTTREPPPGTHAMPDPPCIARARDNKSSTPRVGVATGEAVWIRPNAFCMLSDL